MKTLKSFEGFRKTSYDLTELMIAVNDNNIVEVKRLVESGVDLNEQDIIGNTASHYAMLKNDLIIFDYLKASGADMAIENNYGEIPEDMKIYVQK